jgi:two-component system, NarL family, nitrate/nitrite response regulator NarL
LLIDDHSLFRESLSRLLQTEPDFRIVATCASASEALALPRLEEIDVVLLDYDLGPEQGTRFLDRAHSAGFPGRILMVTAGMSDSVMLRMLENGSSGVFLKHSPPSRLVEAIRKVFAGEVWLDPAVTRSIIAAATGNAAAPRRAQGLTEREQAIGARLAISESSVKAVLQQLFEKTGVRTRSQLVRIALEKHSDEWLTNPT